MYLASNLTADVIGDSNPVRGTERRYLNAQIYLIQHAVRIVRITHIAVGGCGVSVWRDAAAFFPQSRMQRLQAIGGLGPRPWRDY